MTRPGDRSPILEHAGGLRRPRYGAHSMGMAAPLYYTADQVRALPDDGNRYEVVYGELLVTPHLLGSGRAGPAGCLRGRSRRGAHPDLEPHAHAASRG